MADSSTYTPEVIARRLKLAEELMAPRKEPIRHWAQGLELLANNAVGGMEFNRAEKMSADARRDAIAQALAVFGGGENAPAMPPQQMAALPPQGTPAPGPAPAGPLPPPPPMPGTPNARIADAFGDLPGGGPPMPAPTRTAALSPEPSKIPVGPNSPVVNLTDPRVTPLGESVEPLPPAPTPRPAGVGPVAAALNAPTAAGGMAGGGGAPNNRAAIIRALFNEWTPQSMQGVLAQKLNPRVELKESASDPITGQKTYQVWNPSDQTLKPLAGSGGSGSSDNTGLLAKGVSALDHNLNGDAYLAQFGPEVQAAVKSYMNGDVMPSGNPRMNSIANFSKTIAQKYGMDMGIPVNDSIYAGKRKMQTELAASTPNSIGGIISNGKSAFGHLANLSDKLADLGGYNGPDIPGGGHIGTTGNAIANVMLPTAETKDKITGARSNLLRYGQEATKFYAGTGGGQEERMDALKSSNPATTTGREKAAMLETEKQLMLERLHQKEQQIVGVMGEKYLSDHPVRTKDLQDAIAKIDTNIAKLRGGGAFTPPPDWEFSRSRKQYRDPSGKMYDMNGKPI